MYIFQLMLGQVGLNLLLWSKMQILFVSVPSVFEKKCIASDFC